TPLPPPLFNASVLGSNEIEVSWTKRQYWVLYDLKYTILYHSLTDHKNQTKEIDQQVNRITLTKEDGIKSYTKYYLYIIVEFINDSTSKSSGPSEPLGPIIIRTDEGRPDQGPNILKIESHIYKHDSRKRNVTVVWEVKYSLELESSQSSWHGKPSKIKVQYRNINKEYLLVKDVPVTPNIPHQVMLTGLNTTDSYVSHVSLCNNKHCGDMGLQKLIAPEKSTALHVDNADANVYDDDDDDDDAGVDDDGIDKDVGADDDNGIDAVADADDNDIDVDEDGADNDVDDSDDDDHDKFSTLSSHSVYSLPLYTPIPNIIVRAESNKQEADNRKGLWESPN
ncbi:hypothetical protein QZH41_010060, partial [Actinostola sp. cb2023]